MTREEIRERAEKLMAEEDIARYDDDNEIGVVERHLLALARATLEEAARAVCANCARGDVPTPAERFVGFGDNVTTWRHSASITKSGEPDLCGADEIHDLIAALDKEASHE